MKATLLILGFLSAALILAQLVMGQLIVGSHDPGWIKRHQHTGYLTVVISLAYIALSLISIASTPRGQTKAD
jgi:tetrahydromethanopterin S-methyltransferase subunit D